MGTMNQTKPNTTSAVNDISADTIFICGLCDSVNNWHFDLEALSFGRGENPRGFSISPKGGGGFPANIQPLDIQFCHISYLVKFCHTHLKMARSVVQVKMSDAIAIVRVNNRLRN